MESEAMDRTDFHITGYFLGICRWLSRTDYITGSFFEVVGQV